MEDGYNMKRLIYLAAMVILLAGCDENRITPPAPIKPAICREWKSSSLTIDAVIYLNFKEDKTFEMYQHVKQDCYELYNGTWTITGKTLSGRYNDGEEWAYDYTFVVDIPVGGQHASLKLTDEDGVESTFSECTIPAVIKETSTVVVRSGIEDRKPWL